MIGPRDQSFESYWLSQLDVQIKSCVIFSDRLMCRPNKSLHVIFFQCDLILEHCNWSTWSITILLLVMIVGCKIYFDCLFKWNDIYMSQKKLFRQIIQNVTILEKMTFCSNTKTLKIIFSMRVILYQASSKGSCLFMINICSVLLFKHYY